MKRSRFWCLLLFSLLQAAGSPVGAQAGKGPRTYPPGRWIPAGGVPPGDETLANPFWLAADDSTIYIFDLADATLKAFAYDGRVRWRFGRAGKGPGEFVSATDVQLDPQGHIWIADGGTLRLTQVSRTGLLMEMIQVNSPVWNVLPFAPDNAWVKLPLRTPFYVVLDSEGKEKRRPVIPPLLSALDFNQAVLVNGLNRAGTGVAAMRWASALFIFRAGDSMVRMFQGIDSVPPAAAVTQSIVVDRKRVEGHRIDPKADPVVESVAVDSDRALVLASSETGGGEIVDTYSLGTGAYLGSYRLPRTVTQIAWAKGRLVGLAVDPVPAVVVWTFLPAHR